MTREDLTKLAREAGFLVDEADFITTPKTPRIGIQLELERFAALVSAAERDACLQITDYCADADMHASIAANCIRSRGKT